MTFEQKCQLLIVGDAAVGKSSILRRFAQNTFNQEYLSTLGIDYFTKDIKINNKVIHVKIWDTAGEERYRSLTQSFLKNGEGILIVFALNNKTSFDSLKFWMDSIQNILDSQEREIPAIILGNKLDLENGREVDKEEAKEFAKNKNCQYFEVSAKTGEGIDESIKYLIQRVVEVIDKNKKENKKENIKIKKAEEKNEKLKNLKDCCNKD